MTFRAHQDAVARPLDVAATYGGKGSEKIIGAGGPGLATIAAEVLAHAREIPLPLSTAAELVELCNRLDDAQRQAIERHGLAAFLVAGPAYYLWLTVSRTFDDGFRVPERPAVASESGGA